ncbi:hypothetical protein SeMB42_g02154 [Synchytrium endobioticum]|uniref:Chromo domain-containing protein n=1 Tax=Synchytrium endobioticum TaxID=286115 RepID=A0A507DGB7_9FUNG|nr:hypothetical protein SeMB42_g02154 [Synchytrium endobioticum]
MAYPLQLRSTEDPNLNQIELKKLDYKWMGPFFVKRKINRVAYEVELPSSMRIHPVFHISLLKRYKRPSDPSKQLPKPPPMQVTSDDGWVIKDIIEVRRRGRGFEYLIDWEGFGPEDRTWEPRWHLNDDRLLQQWHQKHPEKISPFGKLRGVVRHGEGGNVTNVTVVSSHDDTAKPSIGQDLSLFIDAIQRIDASYGGATQEENQLAYVRRNILEMQKKLASREVRYNALIEPFQGARDTDVNDKDQVRPQNYPFPCPEQTSTGYNQEDLYTIVAQRPQSINNIYAGDSWGDGWALNQGGVDNGPYLVF